jgi:hypothetical protein
MMYASRIVVQMLCLLSYMWASTCIANVLQMHQFSQQEPNTELIVDQINDSLIVHHHGYRDQHEPQAKLDQKADSDHVVKLACEHPDLSAFFTKASLAKALIVDVLLAYLPPPVFSYTATAKTLLLAQQPPPQSAPPPISRNSSIAIVQLTRLRI